MIVLADAVQQAPYTADTEQHPEKSDLFALARGWHGRIELTLNDTWRGTYTFKLKLKPAVDWIQNGRTGSVGEIEGGFFFRRDWRAWMMLGHRMTGPSGIPSTYSDRIELGIARKF